MSTVLIIEDDTLTNKLLTNMLSYSGYSVLNAQDAEAGYQLALTHQPQFILLDLRLPGYSGLEIARAMRQQPALDATRIIAITAQMETECRDDALDAGCDHFIGKPFTLDQLRGLLDSIPV